MKCTFEVDLPKLELDGVEYEPTEYDTVCTGDFYLAQDDTVLECQSCGGFRAVILRPKTPPRPEPKFEVGDWVNVVGGADPCRVKSIWWSDLLGWQYEFIYIGEGDEETGIVTEASLHHWQPRVSTADEKSYVKYCGNDFPEISGEKCLVSYVGLYPIRPKCDGGITIGLWHGNYSFSASLSEVEPWREEGGR